MADLVLTDQNFEAEVLKSDMPVLVDFWATWCGPCKIVSPTVEALAGEYQGKMKVRKMDVDQNPQTSEKYGIMSIPTLAFFNKGEVVGTLIGAQPKEAIKAKMDQILASK